MSSNNEEVLKPLTVRDLPEDVHAALEEAAKANLRSKNNQAIIVLRDWAAKQHADNPVDE